jgi:hypothetical protein
MINGTLKASCNHLPSCTHGLFGQNYVVLAGWLAGWLILLVHILCELKWNQVTEMQRTTAWTTTSVQVEAFTGLVRIKDLLQITTTHDKQLSRPPTA